MPWLGKAITTKDRKVHEGNQPHPQEEVGFRFSFVGLSCPLWFMGWITLHFATNIDNYPIRQANYRIRWEALLASAWGGCYAAIAIQAV